MMTRRALSFLAALLASTALARAANPVEHFHGVTIDTPLAVTSGGLGNATGDASALSALGRTFAARESDTVNALDYSGFAAGVSAAQAAGKPLRLPASSYSYTSTTTLIVPVPVIFEPGAQLTCGASNITFTNVVHAGRSQIFASGCTPSFWSNNFQSPAYPEWWGAVGNATGVSGVGVDSTAAFSAAIASGVAQISLAGGANYRWSSLSTSRSHVSIIGADRGSTSVTQDDPTGLLDGLLFTNGSGQNTIKDINFSRAQSGIGSVASAEVIAGGAGYAVADTLTVKGTGALSAGQRAVLTVTSVSGGAITGLSVTTPGAYLVAAPPTLTLTLTPAVTQLSTSGGGTGASFKLLWVGPALLHLQDTYYDTIQHNTFAGSNSWDQIKIDDLAGNDSQIYLRDNQIFSANHDGIFIYGPSASAVPGDIWIDNNYVELAKNAGIEVRGFTNGIFVTLNALYNDHYGQYWDADAATYISSSKIRGNDIDSNAAGDYYFGLNESQYQQNWHSDLGSLVCTSCTNVQGDGNFFTMSTNPAIYFNGSAAMDFSSSKFTGGSAGVVFLGPYGSTQSSEIVLTGEDWSFGGGYFLNPTGAPSNVTVGVTLSGGSQAVINPSASINNLTIVGSQSPSNNANNGLASVLYGSNNSVGANFAAAGGSSNGVYGYASTAFGANNNVGGAFSNVRGAYAADDGLTGADCVASGSTIAQAGSQEICHHVLRGRTSTGGAVRLTSDGNAASLHNCLNLPVDSHSQFQVMVSGYNPTTTATADWSSIGPNALTVGASLSATYYVGSYTTATPPPISTGTGSSATLQLSADTTNGCLNVTIVAPSDAYPWDWEAAFVRLKMQ